MQRMAWLLLIGMMVGCGSSKPAAIVRTYKVEETVVPAEVAPLFEQGELAKAIETLSAMIQKTPRDENLFALRATARHRIGDNEGAIEDLNQAIALKDHDAKLYNNRGFIRLGMGQFDAAAKDFDRATELAPKYMNAYNNRGLLLISQGQFIEAITQFNHAIEIDDQYIDAYNNRGFAEFEAGLIEQALDDFNLAIRLNHDYVNAYNNRGLLRARAGDYENAIVDFTHAMMIDPLNPKYYEHRREAYQRQGSLDKKLADEKKIEWLVEYHRLTSEIAATIQPATLLIQRARHFIEVGDFEKATSDLDRILAQTPDSSEALAVRAGIHFRRKSIAKAKADALASLAIEPTQEAYSILGDVFLSQGDYDHAIENFAYARRVDPSVAEAYYAKSKALAKQGQDEQAKVNLEQALVLDPDVESRLR